MDQNNTINPSTEGRLLIPSKYTEGFNIATGRFAARRTFIASGSDVQIECIIFENLMVLNNWSQEKARRMVLCLLRGQENHLRMGYRWKYKSTKHIEFTQNSYGREIWSSCYER